MKLVHSAFGWLALLSLLTVGSATASSALPSCDRECLYGHLEAYLGALERRDATRLPWSKDILFTENNVALQVGDGLWGTITALHSYRLKFADVENGQVGFFGAVQETTADWSPFALRLRVADGKISEVESVVFRLADEGPMGSGGDRPHPFANPKFEDKPALLEVLPEHERRPRARMISIADGYFDTLQLNDGQLFTEFAADCNRIENGVQTTNNAALGLTSVVALGCEEQFRMGNYRYDDRLRGRRFHVIDEQRGLVFASAFIDHSGRLGTYQLANGKTVESPVRRPHSYYAMELFKIKNGRIQQVEAVFLTVPYHMPSPWDEQR